MRYGLYIHHVYPATGLVLSPHVGQTVRRLQVSRFSLQMRSVAFDEASLFPSISRGMNKFFDLALRSRQSVYSAFP